MIDDMDEDLNDMEPGLITGNDWEDGDEQLADG